MGQKREAPALGHTRFPNALEGQHLALERVALGGALQPLVPVQLHLAGFLAEVGGLGLLAMCKGQSAEARRKLEQAIEVCERHGLMERLTVARINLIELYHFTGNFRKGLAVSDQTVSQSREVRYRFGVGLGMRYRTLMLTDIGRFSEAMDNALASLKIHQEMDGVN